MVHLLVFYIFYTIYLTDARNMEHVKQIGYLSKDFISVNLLLCSLILHRHYTKFHVTKEFRTGEMFNRHHEKHYCTASDQ